MFWSLTWGFCYPCKTIYRLTTSTPRRDTVLTTLCVQNQNETLLFVVYFSLSYRFVLVQNNTLYVNDSTPSYWLWLKKWINISLRLFRLLVYTIWMTCLNKFFIWKCLLQDFLIDWYFVCTITKINCVN